jgi:hypothetical protein
MKKIELTEATKPLAEYVKDMDGVPIAIMYHGIMLAALVPMESDYESVTLATDPQFRAMLEQSRKSYREEGGVSAEEVRKMFADDKDDEDKTPC